MMLDSSKRSSSKLSKNTLINSEVVFVNVIQWINSKIHDECLHLYTLNDIKNSTDMLIKCNITKSDSVDNYEKFYLRAGELLALLYILNIKSLDEESIISMAEHPIIVTSNIKFNTTITNQLSYANEITKYIINNSVYKLNFLPDNNLKLTREYVRCIKEGFSLIYSLVVENKNELFYLINKFTDNESLNLNTVLSRVRNLNLNDMRNQMFFINEIFSKNSVYKIYIDFSKDTLHKSINKEKLTSIACKIGDYIIERSIIGYKDSKLERTWICTMGNGIIEPMDGSLYRGNSGVALFLAYLGTVTNKQYFISAAMEAMQPVLRYISQVRRSNQPSSDLIGIFYTLSKIYNLTYNEKIKKFIKDNITVLSKFSETNKKFDESYNDIFVTSKLLDVTKIKALEKFLEEKLRLERQDEKEIFHGLSAMLFSKLMLKKTCSKDALLDKEIRELTEAIISKGIRDNLYYSLENLRLLGCAADTLNDTALKNRCDNTFNLIVDKIMADYRLKKFNLFEQSISLINGLSGLGYSLISCITKI